MTARSFLEVDDLTPDELEEVVVEAWLARAPQRLAKEYLAGQGIEG